ncbi:MAG: ATP-binding protein [Clostridia bacterium]|nr:ATP-binding protein [Clostridia bacterium]
MRMIDLPVAAGRVTCFVFILLSLFAVICALFTRGNPKARVCRYVSELFALLSFLPVTVLEEYSVWTDLQKPFTPWVERCVCLPAWLYFLAALLLAAAEIAVALRLRRIGRTSLTAQSVREGLDQLPDGVCFSLPDGFPRLVNNRMQQISNSAFGAGVSNALALNSRLENRDFLPGCAVDVDKGNTFFILADGSVWQIRQQTINAAGKPFTETIAYDVTERYKIICELRKRNERLEVVNRHLRDYLNNIDRSVREKEILNAKITLHNRLGQCLLIVNNYLGGSENDRKAVTDQLRETVALLQSDAPDAPEADRLDAVRKAADAVGVEIAIRGEIPERYKSLFEVALHECLTNTVKHAKGHRLEAGIDEADGVLTMTFTNDGIPPKSPIRETGGLHNLRVMAGKQNGSMEIESAPAFRLTLRFRQEEMI